jgi:hypothetical protein
MPRPQDLDPKNSYWPIVGGKHVSFTTIRYRQIPGEGQTFARS